MPCMMNKFGFIDEVIKKLEDDEPYVEKDLHASVVYHENAKMLWDD